MCSDREWVQRLWWPQSVGLDLDGGYDDRGDEQGNVDHDETDQWPSRAYEKRSSQQLPAGNFAGGATTTPWILIRFGFFFFFNLGICESFCYWLVFQSFWRMHHLWILFLICQVRTHQQTPRRRDRRGGGGDGGGHSGDVDEDEGCQPGGGGRQQEGGDGQERGGRGRCKGDQKDLEIFMICSQF